MKIFALTVLAAWLVVPTFISANDGALSRSIVGDLCLVPVFHTEFMFPPEGGQIIKTSDGSMYFVRTYAPGCANAGSIGTVITTHGIENTGTIVNAPAYTTPVYTAPKTGCSVN